MLEIFIDIMLLFNTIPWVKIFNPLFPILLLDMFILIILGSVCSIIEIAFDDSIANPI